MRMRQLFTIVALLGTSVPLGLAQDSSSFKTLYSFAGGPDGGNPQAGVVIGARGVLYGTTNSGGTSNQGTVFELAPPASPGATWTETVLHEFAGPDGANPSAGVVIGSGGVLYGATYNGGASGVGTVFDLTPPPSPGAEWSEAVLWSFSPTGPCSHPATVAKQIGTVVVGGGGVLYGTMSNPQYSKSPNAYGCAAVH